MIGRLRFSGLLFVLVELHGQAPNRCATCHPKQVAGFASTGMGKSLAQIRSQPGGKFRHALSGSELTIRVGLEGMVQTLEREEVAGSFKADYVIGSGNHAFGYLVNIGGYLFQSPISYYSKRRIWDMAPGYEADRNPDFTRPVTAECLWCHSGRPRPVANTVNKYEQPPFAQEAISCERCHGSAEAHIQKPSPANIVNPGRLSQRARDSVCEQCHLSGEARIPNPGKQIGEFRPGQNLEDIFSVYVFERPVDTRLTVISHVQQLAQSKCQIQSEGKLWCGTCHDPHTKPADPVAYYRAKCLACHGGVVQTHAKPSDDCVRCHMPARPARDGGHTAFTDHEIQRKAAAVKPATGGPQKLVAWHEPAPDLRSRNLGLAYVTVGERDRSAFHMDEASRLLSAARTAFGSDGAVLTSLGLLALRQRKPAEALQLFQGALEAEPNYPPYLVNLATALKQAGRPQEAEAHLDRAIALDPSLEPAYRKLAEIAREAADDKKLRRAFERYLKFMPNNVSVRIALQAN